MASDNNWREWIIGILLVIGVMLYNSGTLSDWGKSIKNKVDGIEVIDRQVEKQESKNNTLTEDETINAVLYEYGVGSVIEGYIIKKPTGYCKVEEIPNYSERNKRKFLIGYTLKNGRTAYIGGIASKKDGIVEIKVDKVILE